jgi:hypothetical protein
LRICEHPDALLFSWRLSGLSEAGVSIFGVGQC